MAEFFNAIYVLHGDASQPNAIHIFDATTKTWTIQEATVPDGFDSSSLRAILNHDSNVFYAFSKGDLYSAEMPNSTTAGSTSVAWGITNLPTFDTSNYQPVIAAAQNHIYFLNIGVKDGLARIFVIRCRGYHHVCIYDIY